jgi:hypothetical protein
VNVLEKEIEAKLVKIVKDAGGLCLKWVCPGFAGVPERICLLPGGRVVFVETKRPKGGVLSRRQIWWRDKLTGLGFMYYVIWNQDDLDRFRFKQYTP